MMIQGNPHIKSADKPTKEALYHINDDKIEQVEDKEVSREEIEAIKNRIFGINK